MLKCLDPESQSFLNDSLHKPDTSDVANGAGTQYKRNRRKQFWHILLGSSFRWLTTFALCVAYEIVFLEWYEKGARSESQKKLFNTLTTGISIALGLNIASAFKEMAVNMRWVVLKRGARSLREVRSQEIS